MSSIANSDGKVILVVDDEPLIALITAKIPQTGLKVIVAADGEAGLRAFLAHALEIDLILTDVVLPVMDGITMVNEIRKSQPEARVLLMSGYPQRVLSTPHGSEFAFIRKPFQRKDLVLAINAMLDEGASKPEASPLFSWPHGSKTFQHLRR
jgi:two-component system cell cycle sensor histidine kinase/response regulator CckA